MTDTLTNTIEDKAEDQDAGQPVDETTADDGQSAPASDSPTVEDWKSHARTWEKRAKESKAEVEAKDARITALEKALEDGTDASEALAASRAQSARYKAALATGIDLETAEKVLTGTDDETITAQAEAFSAAVKAAAEASAESAPRRGVRESPNEGLQGAEKPDYKAQAEALRRKY